MRLGELIVEIKKRYDMTIIVDHKKGTDALFRLDLYIGRVTPENKLRGDFYYQEDSPEREEFAKKLLKRIRKAYIAFNEPDRDDNNLFGDD